MIKKQDKLCSMLCISFQILHYKSRFKVFFLNTSRSKIDLRFGILFQVCVTYVLTKKK